MLVPWRVGISLVLSVIHESEYCMQVISSFRIRCIQNHHLFGEEVAVKHGKWCNFPNLVA